ncbi:cell envelope protein [Bradyrhizobium sp. LTSPM299]|uniref:DUF1254 domain-containing protein n=1 Tax=Bradyrhizobium sp. LTSPM299 TaxID=1619233 RepID=UPI0005C9F2AC|nr:DUF1254 domain-containing protein [Bradyrhizobium sp. LTSPM299]KJC57592.1 cell envelope protein [Bradyrhizobium sp. LTSPM299]
MLTKRDFLRSAAFVATAGIAKSVPASAENSVSLVEARRIAREAYVYGFPLVDSYRIQYKYFVDRTGPEFKAPWGQIANTPRVYTPADTAVQTPNSDTPYSWLGLDLRTEPFVIAVPEVEKNRYYSIQFTDAYTFNIDYAGTSTTGSDAANLLVVGPGWRGEIPKGIKKVIRSETDILMPIYRVQLFDPTDIDNVKKVQAGFKVQPLSSFLGKAAPKTARPINFVEPLTVETQKTSLEFFNILNFVLRYCPTDPSEVELMKRFARIGVGAGKTFDPGKLSPEMTKAIEGGRADAWADFATLLQKFDGGKVTSSDVFGTRKFLNNNYLYRMGAAVLGIYGNSKKEAIYPFYGLDEANQKLTGTNKYTLRFPPDKLPPVNAFWSLTMYRMPESLLVDNPINRYLLNSTMMSQFKRDADGGLTLLIQNENPGKDKEANWLPAPQGPFRIYLRLYWPKAEALNGKWQKPPLKRVT